jgi:hypothetical protein
MKNPMTPIGNRTRDRPACGAGPQQTAPLETSRKYEHQEAYANSKTHFDPYKFVFPRVKSKLPRRLFQDTPEIQGQSSTILYAIPKQNQFQWCFRQWKKPGLTF